jgi:histidyl-tRNA synthetase
VPLAVWALCTVLGQHGFVFHLRDALPQMKLMNHCGGGNFKKQMKRADQSGASIALIIGQDEMASQQVAVKYLREQQPQETVFVNELAHFIKKLFNV